MPDVTQPGAPGPSWLDRLLGARLVRTGVDGRPVPETISQRLVRLAPPTTLAALLLSLLVHLVILLIAALVAIGTPQAGGAGPGDTPIELAIVTDEELAKLQEAAVTSETPAAPEVPLPDTSAIDLTDASIGDAVPALTESISISANVGGGDIAGSTGLGLGGTGGGAATFFGAEARGTRFAYIVDVSGSMGYDGKIETLKRELTKSIDALLENAKFLVVAFSNDAYPLEGRREWLDGSDAGKLRARRAIAGLAADGGTVPGPAFDLVFKMRPRPDAIYFMTDGLFDPSVALDVLRLNAEDRIPVHCICFVSKESEALMKRIAQDSGGTYTFVAGPGGSR